MRDAAPGAVSLKTAPDYVAICTGPGCGVQMAYREFRTPSDFLAIRATHSRCVGCTKHGGKGQDGGKSAGIIEDVEFLLTVGESVLQIAPRVGYRDLATMYRLLKRRGREDLIARLRETVDYPAPSD